MDERKLALRDKIIGVLLRHARLSEKRSTAECAHALGVSPARIEAYEEGLATISLPELEVLGYLLNRPVTYFLGSDSELSPVPAEPDFRAMLNLRHRLIGALLRQARREVELDHEDLAELLGCSTDRISDYELGQKPMPVTALEQLAPHLGVQLEYFLSNSRGALGAWHRQREIDSCIHRLPPEMQAFVAEPTNLAYIRLAMRLSEVCPRELREVAQALVEVTS